MHKTLIAIGVAASLLGGAFPAFADTTETNATLLTELNKGAQGDTVKLLQALLSGDPSIYPEGLITGTFGPLTAKAVMRFQQKHGLEQAGRVGPKTLKALRDSMASTTLAFEDNDEDRMHGKRLCIPPGHLIAPGWLKHQGNDQMWPTTASSTASTTMPLCKTELPKGIKDKLGSTTVQYWHDTKGRGNDDKHDTTVIIKISGVSVSHIASTTASVNWLTNGQTTSKVYYGTTTPLTLTTAMTVSAQAPVGTHHLSVTGLATSTTYYYVVESSNASSTATSTQKSFTTLGN